MRPTWETADLGGVLISGHLSILGEEAHRHGLVQRGPAGRAYSDSYLNDNWILVR